MADYPNRYSQSALKYLSDHAQDIDFVAGNLAVSPLAVAAGIAREQTMESDIYHRWSDIHKYTAPIKSGAIAYEMNSSDGALRKQYDNINQLPTETLMNPGFRDKASHLMFLDVGPGNIKLRTAVGLLDNYNAQYNGGDDFLGLNQYRGNLPQFVTDLYDPTHDLTAKISGLLAQEGTQFYQRHMTPTAWNYLTEDQKAGAIAQYYVRGPEKLAQEAAGQEFWFPDFSKPGSSFYNYKDNADVLRAALDHNTYPLDVSAPQPATASIGSPGNNPYTYVNVPTPPSMPQNALTFYPQQAQTASPSIGNVLYYYGGLNTADLNAAGPNIGNAPIPQTNANAPADPSVANALATMALMRAFGLPPGTDIAAQPAAQP
ncbi:MAG: hypothetical protein ACLP7P_10540 [Rhodomicrobium sp.]